MKKQALAQMKNDNYNRLREKKFNIEQHMVLEIWEKEIAVLFDYSDQKFTIISSDNQKGFSYSDNIYPLDKIAAVAMIQDGDAVHQNAIAPGMVGAALFGLGGAIAGATAMHDQNQVGTIAIKLLFEDFSPPSMTILILDRMVPKASIAHNKCYQYAQQLYGIFEGSLMNNKLKKTNENRQLQSIIHEEKSYLHENKSKDAADPFDKLRQLAKLRDEGIISQQEFDEKKKDILNKI